MRRAPIGADLYGPAGCQAARMAVDSQPRQRNRNVVAVCDVHAHGWCGNTERAAHVQGIGDFGAQSKGTGDHARSLRAARKRGCQHLACAALAQPLCDPRGLAQAALAQRTVKIGTIVRMGRDGFRMSDKECAEHVACYGKKMSGDAHK